MMKSVLFATIVVAHFATGDAFKCYKCKYPPTLACGAEFDKDGLGVRWEECDPLFNRCAKFVTGPNITRDCDGSLEDFDGNVDIPEEEKDYWCETNLCNGASSIDVALSTLVSLAPALILASQK